jgi:tRNA A-37 threonylcarbamoyl transferase component Bud32
MSLVSSPVGTLLNGRYRLDAEIGTGGMSTVYRAFDTVLERQVAIKIMHREIAEDSDQLERFRREARAVAQLNHPHIVTVIDAGEDDSTPYIVFEHIEGETLKARVRRHGRLPISEAVAYAIEIARALGVAHDRGIVHRDVKPQNVLVDEEGSAKVTDFGIARTLDQEGLTADGRVLGTTDYVSPEQALGHPVTGQSDIYSLGVVLFEMLTGDVPFLGENQVAVAMKHVREELPDVQIRRPEVSSALAAVLEKLTAKDTATRYRDDREVVAALEDVLSVETARAGHATGEATTIIRTLPSSTRRRIPARAMHPALVLIALAAVAAAVVLVLVLGANNTHRGTGKPRGVTAPTATSEQVNLGQSRAQAFDPYGGDGEHDELAAAVLDRIPGTSWMTSSYTGGFGSKPGVGISIDARPQTRATQLVIDTPTPGWKGIIYGAPNASTGRPDSLSDWTAISESFVATEQSDTVQLTSGATPYRYFLIWITKLPPSTSGVDEQAKISEVTLYRAR